MLRKTVGSWVRLKAREREGFQKARIKSEHPKMARGAVCLDRRIGGYQWWNKADLVLTTPPARSR